MAYKPLLCPRCGAVVLDAEVVRSLTRSVALSNSVGTAVAIVHCPNCNGLWGVVVASDMSSWLILAVEVENLMEVHEVISEGLSAGVNVNEIAEILERQSKNHVS